MMIRRTSLLLAVTALAGSMALSCPMRGQMVGMESHAKAKPSTTLTLTGPDGKVLTLSPADLKAMPHHSVTVRNAHTQANESYSGVALTDLLAKVGVPVGKDLKGKAYAMYVLGEGTDHYKVLYSLDEVDALAHQGEVMIADTLNGSPLAGEGAFKLVSSEDKRPARWVRNLMALTVKVAE